MSAPAQDDPLDAFKQRAADRARLGHLGKIALHDAVVVLDADASRAGVDTDDGAENFARSCPAV